MLGLKHRRPSPATAWRPTAWALAAVVAVALSGGGALAASQDDAAGSVTRLHGELTATTPTDRRVLAEADPVYEGETLRTGRQARARIEMRDGGVLTLGEEAAVDLARMLFEQEAGPGEAVFAVLKGAFQMTSGSLGKAGAVTVTTPVATIGIRGTDFWGIQDGDGFSVVLLDEGRVEVTTEGGTVVLDAPREGIDITDPAAPMPAEPNRWPRARIQRALETVAWPDP